MSTRSTTQFWRRRLPLALVATAATLVAGYGLMPLDGLASAQTPVSSLSTGVDQDVVDAEPTVPHIPATRATRPTLPVRIANTKPSVAPKTVATPPRKVVRRAAPARTAAVPSQALVRTPAKAAPRPTSKPAPKPATKPAPKPATKPAPKPAATNDGYPWAHSSGTESDTWGFTQRQCVSYAAWRLSQAGHAISNSAGWGNAEHWDTTARAEGFTVTATARVGDVAHWNAHESSDYYGSGSSTPNGTFTAGGYGHVGYVTQVFSDGSVQVAQYNADGQQSYSSMHLRAPRYLRP